MSPLPVRFTTRIIKFLVGNPYKPSFPTVTGWGDNPSYHCVCDFITHDFLDWRTGRPMSLMWLHLVTPMSESLKGSCFCNRHLFEAQERYPFKRALKQCVLKNMPCIDALHRLHVFSKQKASNFANNQVEVPCWPGSATWHVHSTSKKKRWYPWTLNSGVSCRLSEMPLFMTHSCWFLGPTMFLPLLTDIESLFPLALSANLHHWTSRITRTE